MFDSSNSTQLAKDLIKAIELINAGWTTGQEVAYDGKGNIAGVCSIGAIRLAAGGTVVERFFVRWDPIGRKEIKTFSSHARVKVTGADSRKRAAAMVKALCTARGFKTAQAKTIIRRNDRAGVNKSIVLMDFQLALQNELATANA